MYKVAKAKAKHCEAMAPHLRMEDVLEVWASSRLTPLKALKESVRVSDEAMVLLEDGEPIAMAGIGRPTLTSNIGVPWYLATPAADKAQKIIARASRRKVKQWAKKYSVLVNFTDVRHTQGTEWLEWLGFTILPPTPTGPDKLPFYPFVMEGTHV